MTFGRRAFLTSGLMFAASNTAARAADAAPATMVGSGQTDPRLSPRVVGDPKAKVIVDEWFSLTCTHCAHFSETVFPEVQAKLIDTGKIRYRFHDFPLDQVALLAAMLARSLPADRYVPFISALFSTQMHWAFASGVDPIAALRQQAALAGITAAQFDDIRADDHLRQAIVDRQDHDGVFLHIDGTPYFRVDETPAPKAGFSYDDFAKAVAKAS